MSTVGENIDHFEVPVCNSFQAKVLNDQLCYEVDLNRFSKRGNIDKELELGFTFLMDYDEDRQVTVDKNVSKTELGLTKSVASSDKNRHATVNLNSIGYILKIKKKILQKYCRSSQVNWRGRIQPECSTRNQGN